MKKLEYKIGIAAPRQKVRETMLHEMFDEGWPKALAKLKEICERNN